MIFPTLLRWLVLMFSFRLSMDFDSRTEKIGRHKNLFKDSKKNYNSIGDPGEYLYQYLHICRAACTDRNFLPERKVEYVHNLLDNGAKRFYCEKHITVCLPHKKACQILLATFSNINMQIRVRKHLQSLSLNEAIEKHSCIVSKALENIRNTIVKSSSQGPVSYRSK